MEPFLGGGEMIADVFQDKSTYAEPPSRFEAGTPAIGEAIGLGAAIDYLTCIGMDQIHKYESWGHICMKALFLFQMYGYMVQYLPKLITVLLYVHSMLRMSILQILQKFLIKSMV